MMKSLFMWCTSCDLRICCTTWWVRACLAPPATLCWTTSTWTNPARSAPSLTKCRRQWPKLSAILAWPRVLAALSSPFPSWWTSSPPWGSERASCMSSPKVTKPHGLILEFFVSLELEQCLLGWILQQALITKCIFFSFVWYKADQKNYVETSSKLFQPLKSVPKQLMKNYNFVLNLCAITDKWATCRAREANLLG